MSFLELLLTLTIAILILKPSDFEKLIKLVAKIYLYCKNLLEQLQAQINDQIKLLELEKNQQRAEIAQQEYNQKKQD